MSRIPAESAQNNEDTFVIQLNIIFKEFTTSWLGIHVLTASLTLDNLAVRHILKAFLIFLKSPPHQCGKVII